MKLTGKLKFFTMFDFEIEMIFIFPAVTAVRSPRGKGGRVGRGRARRKREDDWEEKKRGGRAKGKRKKEGERRWGGGMKEVGCAVDTMDRTVDPWIRLFVIHVYILLN